MSKQNTFNSMNNSENKTIEELRAYNKTLEQSSEYKRILPEVMKEVYTLFVKERIVSLERLAETEGLFGYDSYFPNDDLPWEQTPIERKMNKPSFQIDTAKSYLPHDPAHAAEVLSQIGSCHKIWALQKQILKEKYGITWYTPSELYPEIKYD